MTHARDALGDARGEFRPIELRRLVRPFLGRGRALLAAILLPVVTIWIGSAWLPPSYQATAQVLLEQDRFQLGKIADVMTAPVLPEQATVSNEIAILRSTPVLEELFNDRGLESLGALDRRFTLRGDGVAVWVQVGRGIHLPLGGDTQI